MFPSAVFPLPSALLRVEAAPTDIRRGWSTRTPNEGRVELFAVIVDRAVGLYMSVPWRREPFRAQVA